VIPAGGAREAFEILEGGAVIDVVLMDMMMPELDGYQATQQLRSEPRWRKLPIIALTAKAMPGDRERALEAGCDDFVAKPVERYQLVEVIRRLTERSAH
jgi:CheY-like chemotaxis protein